MPPYSFNLKHSTLWLLSICTALTPSGPRQGTGPNCPGYDTHLWLKEDSVSRAHNKRQQGDTTQISYRQPQTLKNHERVPLTLTFFFVFRLKNVLFRLSSDLECPLHICSVHVTIIFTNLQGHRRGIAEQIHALSSQLPWNWCYQQWQFLWPHTKVVTRVTLLYFCTRTLISFFVPYPTSNSALPPSLRPTICPLHSSALLAGRRAELFPLCGMGWRQCKRRFPLHLVMHGLGALQRGEGSTNWPISHRRG